VSFSQDALSLTVPPTPSTPTLSLPAPTVASTASSSIASIPAEKLSIWTFFRHARGSEPDFRPKERSDRSGKSSNKRLHYCIACWDNKKKSWSTGGEGLALLALCRDSAQKKRPCFGVFSREGFPQGCTALVAATGDLGGDGFPASGYGRLLDLSV
jgi:hypothetical protein